MVRRPRRRRRGRRRRELLALAGKQLLDHDPRVGRAEGDEAEMLAARRDVNDGGVDLEEGPVLSILPIAGELARTQADNADAQYARSALTMAPQNHDSPHSAACRQRGE